MKQITRYELTVREAKAIIDLLTRDMMDRRVPAEAEDAVFNLRDFLRFNADDALETGVGVGIRLRVELI